MVFLLIFNYYPLEVCFFPNRKERDPYGKGSKVKLGRIEVELIVIWIHSVRKKFCFQNKEKCPSNNFKL